MLALNLEVPAIFRTPPVPVKLKVSVAGTLMDWIVYVAPAPISNRPEPVKSPLPDIVKLPPSTRQTPLFVTRLVLTMVVAPCEMTVPVIASVPWVTETFASGSNVSDEPPHIEGEAVEHVDDEAPAQHVRAGGRNHALPSARYGSVAAGQHALKRQLCGRSAAAAQADCLDIEPVIRGLRRSCELHGAGGDDGGVAGQRGRA